MDTVIAGAIAATTVDLLVYPLDTLKTRLQLKPQQLASSFPRNSGLYSGLYQGVGSVLIATLPAAGVFFTTYEHSKSFLSSSSNPLVPFSLPPAAIHMLSSSIAEMASCLVLTPAELIKQRSQVVNRNQQPSSPTNTKSAHHHSPRSHQPSEVAFRELSKSADQISKGEKGLVEGVEKGIASSLKESSKVAPRGSALSTTRALAEDASRQLSRAQAASSSESSASVFRPMLSTLSRSYLALAGRNLPFTAIQFPLYEKLKSVFSEKVGLNAGSRSLDSGVDLGDVELDEVTRSRAKAHRRLQQASKSSLSNDQQDVSRESSPTVENRFILAGLVSGGSAALSGSISALITTPIDVAKTRIMLNKPSGSSSGATRGVFHTMRQIALEEGIGPKGLLKGGLYRSLFTALGAGVYLGSYESGRLWWRSREIE